MNIVVSLVRLINIVTAAVVAGGQIRVLLVTIPGLRQFSPEMSLQIQQTMLGDEADPYMPISTMASGFTAVILLLFDRDAGRKSRVLGLAGTLGVVVTSLAFHGKMNRQMRAWKAETPPPAYAAVRRQWDRMHAVRTACGTVALACYVIAMTSRRD